MAVLLLSLALEAFVCPTPPSVPHRAAPVVMSAKIIPVANVALGSTLLYRAASANGANALVLASTGLLATCNLALTDNARYASAKRAMAKVENVELPLAKLAKRWYNAVRVQVASAPLHLCTSTPLHASTPCPFAPLHGRTYAPLQVFGQLVALVWMARASSPTGVLRGGVAFMAANVAFFLLGAGETKHDGIGVPAPMKPGLQTFVLTTDAVLMGAALCGALAPVGSLGRAAASGVFATGCLIGAAEGVPKTAKALSSLTKAAVKASMLVYAR